MPKQPKLAVTNPLHYVYFRKQQSIAAIGSTRGLLADYAERLGFNNDMQLYDTANTLSELINVDNDPDAQYVTWKPVDSSKTVLGNEYAMATNLERKSIIRTMLPSTLFPQFYVITKKGLSITTYAQLQARLRTNRLVLQIDQSTGGKGTYFVTSEAEFVAIQPLLQASRQKIVASAWINGLSRGLQCLLLDGELYMTKWWHRDLVALAGIANLQVEAASRYCGAILEDIPVDLQATVNALSQQVANGLNRVGYSGVFGIDIVVEPTGDITLIEVNTRFTAVSHLYATAMHAMGYGIDFLTAQIGHLVHGEVSSAVITPLQNKPTLDRTYFYLKLQNDSHGPVQLTDTCRLGVYDNQLQYQRFGWGIDALQNDQELVIIPEVAQATLRAPGERIFSIIGSGDPLQDGRLSLASINLVTFLRQKFLKSAI